MKRLMILFQMLVAFALSGSAKEPTPIVSVKISGYGTISLADPTFVPSSDASTILNELNTVKDCPAAGSFRLSLHNGTTVDIAEAAIELVQYGDTDKTTILDRVWVRLFEAPPRVWSQSRWTLLRRASQAIEIGGLSVRFADSPTGVAAPPPLRYDFTAGQSTKLGLKVRKSRNDEPVVLASVQIPDHGTVSITDPFFPAMRSPNSPAILYVLLHNESHLPITGASVRLLRYADATKTLVVDQPSIQFSARGGRVLGEWTLSGSGVGGAPGKAHVLKSLQVQIGGRTHVFEFKPEEMHTIVERRGGPAIVQ